MDKEIKCNEKKRKRKEADKLRRQKRIRDKADQDPPGKHPFPQAAGGLGNPQAPVAAATDGTFAGQQKVGAVHPNVALQQQLAQQLQAQQ